METIVRTKIKDLLKEEPGKEVIAKGWVRTKRGNKQVKFIALNDGSTINNIQVVAETESFDEELIKKTEDARASINSQAAALEKEVNEFQRKVQTNAFLNEQRAQSEANRLQNKKDQLDQLNYKLQNDLAQEQAQMNDRLIDTIQSVLKEYNAVKKFELILSNTMHDNILLDNPKYDITNELLEILNSRYAENK